MNKKILFGILIIGILIIGLLLVRCTVETPQCENISIIDYNMTNPGCVAYIGSQETLCRCNDYICTENSCIAKSYTEFYLLVNGEKNE